MRKETTKNKLLEIGAWIVHRKGYNNTGIQEVLEAASVPKGSFYFYFNSKEDFGLQLIDFYAGVILQTLHSCLEQELPTVIEKVRRFFNTLMSVCAANNFVGCPIGNLTQEMADQNETFRVKLEEVYSSLQKEIAEQLGKAQALGEIDSSIDPVEMSEFVINSFQGAIMEMKLTRDMRPFELWENVVFDNLLRGQRETARRRSKKVR